MNGHIQDRWFKTEIGSDGKRRRVQTERHGTGKRYRARYVGPDGKEHSESFPDRQRRQAVEWLDRIKADMSRGQYIDPSAGRISFQDYARTWLSGLTIEATSIEATELRLRLHVFPRLGARPLNGIQPADVRQWSRDIQDAGLAASYQRVIFANLSAVLSAAVDDGLISRNPCRANSVRAPRPDARKVRPWSADKVFRVRTALPEQYRAMVDAGAGCGLRQGEIFGLAVDEIDFVTGIVHVTRQIKVLGSRLVFAPPKGNKVREVPLPDAVAGELSRHITLRPPLEVTLPWRTHSGPLVTAPLLFYTREHSALHRSYFNPYVWKPALVSAGALPARRPGASRYEPSRDQGMHALRHFYASVLLDAGESIKALSEYLGHSDPGFTLRTYTHLMPSSASRTRNAVSAVFDAAAKRCAAETTEHE
ncbi:MAG TPA: site-specific integrase [Actinocrinis sp.]|jgi:integrase